MDYGESNGRVIDDVTIPWKVEVMDPIRRRSRDHSIPYMPFPICFFRQFFGTTTAISLATIQYIRYRQTGTTL